MSSGLSPITNVAEMDAARKLPISPLAGEMAGKPEGGAVPPACQSFVMPAYFPPSASSNAATPLTIAARSWWLSLASNSRSNAFASGTISR